MILEELHKSSIDLKTGRDNFDKKELLYKESHPKSANQHKDNWLMIYDNQTRANIAYHLQHCEFLIALYNNYQIYLTAESLLMKDVLIHVKTVLELVLYGLLCEQTDVDENIAEALPFDELTQTSLTYGLIPKEHAIKIGEIGMISTLLDLRGKKHHEHEAYTVEEANDAISTVNSLHEFLDQTAAKKTLDEILF